MMRELYYLHLDGRPYGIWKDEISDVREVPSIHRLPLSPAAIAGVALMNGRSAPLADLAVCMGLRPALAVPERRVLVVAGREDGAGFLIGSGVSEASVPDGDVHAVPEYLRTAEADTCVIRDGRPVPIINISRMHDRLQQLSSEPLSPSFTAPPSLPGRSTASGPVRLVFAGDELFAIPEEQLRGSGVRPSGIAAVGLTPGHVRGMAFHDSRVLPVIHVAERLGTGGNRTGDVMLAADHAGAHFGLLVQEERGVLRPPAFVLRELPPVAATGWCASAVVSQGGIVPLLDIGMLVSRKDPDDAAAGLAGRYSPDARFPEAFERTAVSVVEFSLLGVRHALPRSEVEDILPYRPYRRLPGALPVVIGVADLGGEVLPVLDLALVFGRRSLEKPNWRMLLVRNGDFRALVITENVFEERTLPREVQRKVPINLPHKLVYGCYPEGVAVRLILNVEALAVHFDRAMVADLLLALTPEMAEAPAELVPSLLPMPQESGKVSGGAAVSGEAGTLTRSQAEERALQEQKEQEQQESADRVTAGEAARLQEEEQRRREAEENVRREAEEQARKAAEEQAARETAARVEQERIAAEAADLARQGAEEQSQREAEENARREAEEQARKAEEELAAREAAEKAAKEAEEQQARETAARREQERIAAEAAALALREEEARAKRAAEEERSRINAAEKAQQEARERAAVEERERQRREQEERDRKAAEEQAKHAENDRLKRESEARERKAAEEEARRSAEAARQAEEERLDREARQERAKVAAAEKARREAEENEQRRVQAAAAVRGAEDVGSRRAAEQAPQTGGDLSDSVPGQRTGQLLTSGRKRAAGTAAGLLALLLLLFLALSGRDVKESVVQESKGTAVTAGQNTAVSTRRDIAAAPGKDTAASSGKTTAAASNKGDASAVPAERAAAPGRPPDGAGAAGDARRGEALVLTVPADRPLESDVYVVKKGDTLWHISKRFTGNPFNYPRVASDNRIANPDLIFPGQRITLKQ